MASKKFFDFTVKDIKNQDWDLSALKGQVKHNEKSTCLLINLNQRNTTGRAGRERGIQVWLHQAVHRP